MKISVAYLPAEAREADLICRFVKGLLPAAKVHKSDVHPPYKHVYLTTKKPAKPRDAKEKR